MEVTEEGLARFFEVVLPHMNEVQRRVVAGAMAEMFGHGGKTAVANASGMSRNTVIKAESEVAAGVEPSTRQRAQGGGDKPLTERQPGLLAALDELVYPETRGNPMSRLRWTSKSSTKLAEELVRQGYDVSSRTVLRLLHLLGYSLQGNAKTTEGRPAPGPGRPVPLHQRPGGHLPAEDSRWSSVDAKKKELVGELHHWGSEWQPEGVPEGAGCTTSRQRAGERATPYGIYDVGHDSLGYRRHRPIRRRSLWRRSAAGGHQVVGRRSQARDC